MPTLDIWLHVEIGELHYVRNLIPTLDWEGGTLGIRLRFEPKDLRDLYTDFLATFDDALAVKAAAEEARASAVEGEKPISSPSKLTVWPLNLVDFLSRRLSQHFEDSSLYA